METIKKNQICGEKLAKRPTCPVLRCRHMWTY